MKHQINVSTLPGSYQILRLHRLRTFLSWVNRLRTIYIIKKEEILHEKIQSNINIRFPILNFTI